MPTTIEELEAAIQDNVSQANSILFLNHNVLEEYEHRQNQVRLCILLSIFLVAYACLVCLCSYVTDKHHCTETRS